MKSTHGFNNDQRGFTLIEMMIAIAITGLITIGISTTIISVMNGNEHGVKQMTVLRPVQNTGYWISTDSLQATSIDPGMDGGLPLVLTWTSFETGDRHEVRYFLSDGTFSREYFLNGAMVSTIYIAEDITEVSFQGNGGKYTLTVTASIGGRYPAIETRTYEITPRAESTED